jgi:preprotein translocase subunit YajC
LLFDGKLRTYAGKPARIGAAVPGDLGVRHLMFISTAYAQAAAAGADYQSQLVQFLPFVLIAGVFYFLLFRPQQQKMKELKQAQSAIRRGDRIVTAGGILGQVSRVINDEEVEVEIAAGVRVRILKSTISTVTAKGEPVKEPKDAKPAEDDQAAAEDGQAPPNSAAKKRRSPTSVK